ncbi:leucine-rich single-pass membrane protein 2 [Numida meleagris]|uniref:leucine-rich single-pass membrane protein 2 n=1 Tax=Numida meleagris TaxID=8996 RepID=UPI000B3DD228|nr:leucine-rich single-pass membrane protein 2 [Numida meleagris]
MTARGGWGTASTGLAPPWDQRACDKERWASTRADITSGRGHCSWGPLITSGVLEIRSPLSLLPADGVGRAEGTVPAEPADPDGMDPGAISLHPVASISDLHCASAGHKGTEGNGPAPSSNRLHRAARGPQHLPTLRPVPPPTICPCPGHPFFLTLLGLLALASLVLAALAVYLSVLQSQSVQALAQWLESQEDAMRQLRAASGQLWARLNASTQRR